MSSWTAGADAMAPSRRSRQVPRQPAGAVHPGMPTARHACPAALRAHRSTAYCPCVLNFCSERLTIGRNASSPSAEMNAAVRAGMFPTKKYP